MENIVATFNPHASKRILLAAHWDSRPYADHDPDDSKHRTPIDGANDGASGVGVLMEVARLLSLQPVEDRLGVDIVFFDLEDYGPHNDVRTAGDDDYWALGSQYWSKTPHLPGYKANFGILLDMVGAKMRSFHVNIIRNNMPPGCSTRCGAQLKIWAMKLISATSRACPSTTITSP